MADDSNKIVITVDADTEQLKVKIGDASALLQNFGDKGGDGFSKLGIQALGFNAILELGAKTLELFHQGLELIEQSESFNNQKLALTNYAGVLGMTQQQVDALNKAIIAASHDTITSVQAQTAAWKLLNAGFTAETIPAVVAFAQRMAETRPEVGGFDQAIQRLSFSLEAGVTRPLKAFGIELSKTGDRQTILNAIMANSQNIMQQTGEGYQTFAQRMKAQSADWTASLKRDIGGALEGVGLMLFGTQVEKAIDKTVQIRAELTRVNEEINKGTQSLYVQGLHHGGYMTALAAQKMLEQELTVEKEKQAAAIGKEESAQKSLNVEIGKSKPKETIIDPTTASNIKIQNQKKMYEALLNDDEEYKDSSDAILKGLEKSKQQEIENTYQKEMKGLQEVPMSQQAYAQKSMEIEKKKYDAMSELAAKYEKEDEILNNAAYNAHVKSNSGYAGLADSRIKMDEDKENAKFQRNVARLRARDLDESTFNKKLEQMADQHERQMAAIRDKYQKASTKGMKDGYLSAVAQMGKSYGNFAKQSEKVTAGMHGVISNSFIQMAKAHQFSMSQMLGNMLEFVGESAIQDGTFKLIAGIYPPNPGLLGVGAAEVALGAALVGVGGGSAPAATAGGGIGTDMAGQAQLNSPAPAATQQKTAQIIINGDLLNSQETVNHIQELIRKNSDVTNYAITAQGQRYGA